MKRFLFVFILLSSFLFAQTKYIFKIESVENMASAKEITDPLRELFQTYPYFNDSLDSFIFISFEQVDGTQVQQIVPYQVTYFLKQNYAIIKEEK